MKLHVGGKMFPQDIVVDEAKDYLGKANALRL